MQTSGKIKATSPDGLFAAIDDGLPLRQQLVSFMFPLRRYFWIVLLFIIGGVALETYRISKEPIIYVSYAKMGLQGRINITSTNVYREELMNFYGTQIDLIQSSEVRRRAHKRVALMHPENPVVKSGNTPSVRLSVRHKEGTSIFELSASSTSATYTQPYLDAVLQEYLALKREQRSETQEVTLSAITAQIQRLRSEINTVDSNIEAFLSANNMVFIREQAANASKYLVGLNQELANLQRELGLINLINQNGEQTSELDREKTQSAIQALLATDSEYLGARQQLRFLEAEYARFSTNLRPNHPKMKRIDDRRNQTKLMLEVYERQSAQQMSARKRSLELRVANLESTIANWQEQAVDLSRRLADYERMQKDLNRTQSLYDQLVSTLQNIDVNSEITRDYMDIFEPASAAGSRKPEYAQRLVSTGAIAALMGLGCVLLIGKWNDIVYTERDLRYDMPTATHIPKMSANQVQLIDREDTRYALLESFRALRSFLLLNMGEAPKNMGQTLSLTSAIPNEGKSTLAANLALSLSFADYKTLLIDADMRKGNQAESFGIKERPGLVDILEGKATWQQALQKTKHENLDCIVAGKAVQTSSELILGENFSNLSNAVRAQYDFIIVDTPPILATDDMANLIPFIDHVLFAVRLGVTPSKSVSTALNILNLRGANVLGYVLNACSVNSSSYYYRSYERYGNAPETDTPAPSKPTKKKA